MSGIETAARVAALREKAARARFAAAGGRLLAAEADSRQSLERLTALGTPGEGGWDELANWHADAMLRAAAVTATEGTVAEAADARSQALTEWQDLSRRRDALDEVLLRWRAARLATADAAAQRVMDDLAKRRQEWA
jgi:hypothetical protein